MFKETLREGLIFIGIAFAPVWAYIAFCLLRGICDDIRRFIRWAASWLTGREALDAEWEEVCENDEF